MISYNHKSFLAAALAALACAGCSQQELIDNQHPKGKITLVASMEDYASPTTKTLIGHSEVSDAIVMKWAVGEKLGAFGESDVNVEFTSTNSAEASTAVFTSTTATEAPQYAYYPYASGVTDKTAVPVSIAQEQVYSDNSSLAAYDFKVATGVEAQEDGSYRMAFRQMLALLEISIDLDGLSGYEPTDEEKIVSVKIEHETATLWGDFTADLTNPDNGLAPVENGEDGVDPSIIVTLSGQPVVTGKCTAYAMTAPADVSGGTWYFEIETTNNLICFISETATEALEAGKFYAVPLTATAIDSRGHHYDETGETLISGAEIISLKEDGGDDPVISEGETANCYMISAAGTYSFDASVMGNGDSGIIADAGFHTSSAAIEGGASAELLWQDTYGFISSVSYDSAAKTITYTASSNVGNACIALKDANGTILWSWHIWGTGDREVKDDVYTNQAGATFTVMDRNLGQLTMLYSTDFHTEGEAMYIRENAILSSAEADGIDPIYCTMYQWGRKDPIPSAGVRYDKDNVSTDISSSYPVLNYNNFSSSDEATIEYSIQNPDYLIDTYKHTSSQLWEKDGNPYLWGGGASTTLVSSMAEDAAGSGWENGKTIYDPCPVGYRVANPYTWTGFVGGTACGGSGDDGNITLKKAHASTFVDYNADGVFGDDEKLTPWDPDNDVPMIDGMEELQRDLRAIVSYAEVNYSNTKWVIKDGDYLLSSSSDVEGAVECDYVTRYYAPVYCQGLFFMADEDDTDGSFYPMLSFRNGSTGGFNTAGAGYYWSSGQGTTTAAAYYLRLGTYQYLATGNNITVDVFETRNGKRDALPVRCVREE